MDSISNTKLVIFDLDGTLLDSSEDIAWVANRTLDAFGYPRMDDSLIKERIGWGVVMLLKQIMPDTSHEKIDEAKRVFLDLYSSHLLVKSVLYPGVIDTIEHLLGKDKKLAVLTNKPVSLSVRIIDELFAPGTFIKVLGGDSLPAKKPDPAPVINIMETLCAGPEESVIVGDSPVDVEAGKGAGISTIGAAYGFRGIHELIEADADIIIESFAELKDIIL
jgi:phosphoglycolate phosphatase